MGQLVGAAEWVRTEGYNLQALMPAGTPGYTERQLRNGEAPKLQAMLRSLLADRFKLVIRSEMREMAAYNLVVMTPGKLKESINAPERVVLPFPPNGPPAPSIRMITPMSRFAGSLQRYLGRPVVDKTELKGLFEIVVEFPELAGAGQGGLVDVMPLMGEQLPRRLEEQLGLRLEPSRGPVEVLVIEHVERPSEN